MLHQIAIEWSARLARKRAFRVRRLLAPLSMMHILLKKKKRKLLLFEINDDMGQIHCVFVIGKARVAPIKAISTPKPLLTAAVLSVKLWQLAKRKLCFLNCPAIF